MPKIEVGGTYGKNDALLVKSIVNEERLGKKRKFFEVQCQVCQQDTELHGEATYLIAAEYFRYEKLPCGCSKNAKYSKEQWFTILSRKAKSNDHMFLGFVEDGKIQQESKVILSCNICSNEWNTCSVHNYMKDRGCPVCANIKRGESSALPDEHYISKFRETGVFPEEIFSFERVSARSRLWNVYCKVCANEKPFVSDRSNLVDSKIPCNCGHGGGFDTTKTGYFYVLTVLIDGIKSIKYGITNFYHRRLVGHKRSLRTVNGEVLDEQVFAGDGDKVLALESAIKRVVPADNKHIDGFKRESCNIVFKDTILKCASLAGFGRHGAQTMLQ